MFNSTYYPCIEIIRNDFSSSADLILARLNIETASAEQKPCLSRKWGFPKMVGFPNNHGVFLLKMIILGREMGVPPFKETPI